MPTSVTLGGGKNGNSNSLLDALNTLISPTVNLTPSPLSLAIAGCSVVGGVASCDPTKGLFKNGAATTSVLTPFPNNGGSQNGFGKIDYHLNDHNSINGEYAIGRGTSNQGSATDQPWWATNKFTKSQEARGVWVWTPNSTWLNEMRFGLDRSTSFGAPAECTESLGQPNYPSALGFQSGITSPAPECGTAFPATSISGGFTKLGTQVTSGGPTNYTETTIHGLDTVFPTSAASTPLSLVSRSTTRFSTAKTRSITFSVASRSTVILSPGKLAALGNTAPTNLEAFLLGDTTAAVLAGNPARHLAYNRLGGFFQDEWRITPRITANLGIRYEYAPPISDGNNQLRQLRPEYADGLGAGRHADSFRL